MNKISARFQTGETIILGMREIAGDITLALTPTAKAKLAGSGLTVPPDSDPVAFTFTVVFREETDELERGYNLIGGPVSVAGNYCANLSYAASGHTFKEQHIFFVVEPSAT